MTRKQLYVVVHGRQPGIYQKWFGEEGAYEQVAGLDDAVFKGFETTDEALQWLRGFDSETLLWLAPSLLDLVEPRTSGRRTKSPEDWLTSGNTLIFADGWATGNSGPGGYGAVLCFKEHRKQLSGGFRRTSAHRMELMASIEGLKALKFACSVTLYSDSRYVVRGVNTGWAKRWQAEEWKLHDDQEVKNADLWKQLLALDGRHHVRFCSMKSCASHPESIRCAELAATAAKGLGLPPDLGYERSTSDPGHSQ